MSGCGCEEQTAALESSAVANRRRVLWTVFAINLVMFAGELGAAI